MAWFTGPHLRQGAGYHEGGRGPGSMIVMATVRGAARSIEPFAPEIMKITFVPGSDVEFAFLRYLASRVDGEVARFFRGEQGRLTTLWNVRRLAALAEEILGEAEVAAWLEASTLAPLLVDQVTAIPYLGQRPAPCVWHWQPKWDPD